MPRHSYDSSSSSRASTPSLTSGSSAGSYSSDDDYSPTRASRRRQPAQSPFPGVRYVASGPEQERLRQDFRSRGRQPSRRSAGRVPPRGRFRPAYSGDRTEGASDSGSESDDSEAEEFRRGRGRWRGMTGKSGLWDSSGRPMNGAAGAERQRGRVRGGRRGRVDAFDGPNLGIRSVGRGRRGPRMRAAPPLVSRPRLSLRAKNGAGGWIGGFCRRRHGMYRPRGGDRMAFADSSDSSSSNGSSGDGHRGYGALGSWGKSWEVPTARPRYMKEPYLDGPNVVRSPRPVGSGGYGYGYSFQERWPRLKRFAIEDDEGWLERMWSSWFGGGRSASIMPWTRWWG